MSSSTFAFINALLAPRLDTKALAFVTQAQAEIQAGVPEQRFTALVALASRYLPRQPLQPTAAEIAAAAALRPGWNPQAWSLLETARVSLVLARRDLLADDFPALFNQSFTHADEGEACAYYRALPLLPEPQRFVWRAAEGCRTNMRSVFMAVACDSPYAYQCFDELAWNQMLLKAIFTETPLARVYGVEQRLNPALAQMTLDYIDERRSAGRSVPDDAWLCLGEYFPERRAQPR